MASVAELEAVVLKGELRDIERKYKLSNAPAREATTQNTEKSAVLSPSLTEEEIIMLGYEEASEHIMWGMRTVLIYAVLLWSFLIWVLYEAA